MESVVAVTLVLDVAVTLLVVVRLVVVAAARQRRSLGEFAHKSVRFEVAPDVRGGGGGGCDWMRWSVAIVVADVLIIRVVVVGVIVVLVIVRQMRIHLSRPTFQQRTTRLIERMIPSGRHGGGEVGISWGEFEGVSGLRVSE